MASSDPCWSGLHQAVERDLEVQSSLLRHEDTERFPALNDELTGMQKKAKTLNPETLKPSYTLVSFNKRSLNYEIAVCVQP